MPKRAPSRRATARVSSKSLVFAGEAGLLGACSGYSDTLLGVWSGSLLSCRLHYEPQMFNHEGGRMNRGLARAIIGALGVALVLLGGRTVTGQAGPAQAPPMAEE